MSKDWKEGLEVLCRICSVGHQGKDSKFWYSEGSSSLSLLAGGGVDISKLAGRRWGVCWPVGRSGDTSGVVSTDGGLDCNSEAGPWLSYEAMYENRAMTLAEPLQIGHSIRA